MRLLFAIHGGSDEFLWRVEFTVASRSGCARFAAMHRSLFSLVGIALVATVAAETLDGVQVGERFHVREIARGDDHPVISPSAFGMDEEGRIYVVETHRFRYGVDDNRNREFWFFDDIASQTTADRRAMYARHVDRVPMEYYTERSEVVRRHVDATGDGKIDQTQVFADGFNDPLDGAASGVFAFEGAVYFSCIPNLWMLRDTNGDGVADERHVIADGFGVRVSFSGHDMNGFALGPDGRIYGTIGDRGFNVRTREGREYVHPDLGAMPLGKADDFEFIISFPRVISDKSRPTTYWLPHFAWVGSFSPWRSRLPDYRLPDTTENSLSCIII